MAAPIFISYSSKDQKIAETIYQALEARGQKCWISCRDVHPGENFQEAIVRALRSAKAMLLVFTSNANNSDEIKKELVLAGRHRVTVVPVRVEDVVPNDAFTYEFATRQWVDLFKDWEREIELLATQLSQIVTSASPRDGAAAETPQAMPPRPIVRQQQPSRNMPLVVGAALAAALIAIGGAVFYFLPVSKTSPPQQTAMRAPEPAPATAPASRPPPAPAPQAATPMPPPLPPQSLPPQQVATPAPAAPAPPPTPAPAPAPQANPDDAAWQAAQGAGTIASVGGYLKEFSSGVHAQEAQLQLANLIMAAPATGKNFDGMWQTTWTCTNYAQYPGYTYQFTGEIKDGSYHGQRGKEGEPSSLVIDGKIESDGTAAFFGKGFVGSSLVALGAPRGTQYAFHALVSFTRNNGSGKRIEGRPCMLSFVKG